MECSMDPDRFAHLLRQARANDSDALGELLLYCERVSRRVSGHAARDIERQSGGRIQVDDVVQEALLRAQRDFGRFQGSTADSFLAWFKQIFHHVEHDVRRRFRTRKRERGREIRPRDERTKALILRQQPAPRPGPLQEVIACEERERVKLRMALLPTRQQFVLYVRVYDGLPFDDIARSLRSTEAAAEQVYWRGLRALREQLDDTRTINEVVRQRAAIRAAVDRAKRERAAPKGMPWESF
jgi:RNA polymerase sigma-70 factor, ECF subfamily